MPRQGSIEGNLRWDIVELEEEVAKLVYLLREACRALDRNELLQKYKISDSVIEWWEKDQTTNTKRRAKAKI